MRFQVPQFIETEDVLFASFTLKQFLIIAAGVIIIFIAFSIFELSFAFFVTAGVVGGGSLYIAKGSIEGVPVYTYLVYAVQFLTQNKQYRYDSTPTDDPLANLPKYDQS